uniref:proline-rich protein PRCC isoform X2 n=1 Tax=Pristiophorus japonicus TaxID=55135 RepID=UPI00398EBA2C
MSLVAYGSSDESEAEAAASPPPPPGPARTVKPVRIRVPELQAASDSDDEEPVQKKTSRGLGSGLGLSALLPQPRNLALKETNRKLLPYSFAKAQKSGGKPSGSPAKAASAPRDTITTIPSPSAIKAASKSAAKQLAKHIMNEEASEEEEGDEDEEDEEDDEDDEEDEGVSFFSLCDKEQPPPGARTELFAGGPAAEGALSAQPQVPAPSPAVPDEPADPLNPADAPLEFNRGAPPASSSPANPGPEFGGQYADYNAPGAEHSEYYQDYYSSYYQDPDPAHAPAPEEELNTFMNDEAKRGEQPTSQQRRKHQITYLIHQAKERELELKNAWSDNRLTKRQTQAKYGF